MKMVKEKTNINVNVTQAVIDKAVPDDCGHCLIAEALRFRGASSVNVDSQYARFNMEGLRYVFPVPATAALQVIMFDKAGPKVIEPFTFKLGNGFSKPIQERASHHRKTNSTTPMLKRKPAAAKHSKRRFHGIKMIELQSGSKLV